MSNKFTLITTGGTIDSYFDHTKDSIVPHSESRMVEYLESLKLYWDYDHIPICMKDSREVAREDVAACAQTIDATMQESRFIVTHGTYTMPDSARMIQAKLQRQDAVVVLLGSMKPLYGFDATDAGFNLGFVLGQLNALQPGVYVAMHGRIFSADEISKTIAEGRFTSVSD